MTSGSQKCMGAKPSFMARAINSIVGVGCVVSWVISQVPVFHALIILENKMIDEAVAWIIKYFVAASVARGWWCLARIGMMARVFSSKPIQAKNQ